MSTLSWFLIGYLIWLVIGVIRFIQLMGRKNYKETFLDKVLLAGDIPIAYLIGGITYVRRKFQK
jgi:hypothetical protein